MELRSDSRIVKWAYWGWVVHHPPARTTICAIFWRSVALRPLQIVLVVATAPLWIPLWAWETYVDEPLTNWRCERNRRRFERHVAEYKARQNAPPPPSSQPPAWRILWEGAKAIKSKVCPFVEIRETEVGGRRP